MVSSVHSSIAEMFGLFAIGWLVHRIGMLGKTSVGEFARLVVDVLLPCLIFNSLITGLDTTRLQDLWILPLLGFGMMVVGAAGGFALRRGLKSRDPDVVRTFHHICAINNYGFLPIFIITTSLDHEALALFFVLNLGSTVGYWTIGVLLLGGSSLRAALKMLASPAMAAIAAGLALAFADAESWLPGFALRTIGRAGDIAVPLVLIMIGASLGGSIVRSQIRDVAYLTLVRLIVLPALYIGILWLIPLADDVRAIAVIVALMPASASSVIMTQVYGGSPKFAAAAILVTTIGAAVTIPLALALIL